MMYGNSRQRSRMNQPDLYLQRRVLLIVCILLLGVSIAMGYLAIRNSAYRSQAETLPYEKMYENASNALKAVKTIRNSTNISVIHSLSEIRGFVYYMEQLNSMANLLSGGKLVPDSCFTELNKSLDTYEECISQAAPTQDICQKLEEQIESLQALLIGS